MRTYNELFKRCDELGIPINPSNGYTKEGLQNLIRDHLWQRDHPDEKMLLQVEPELAQSIEELNDKKAEDIWNSKDYCAQLKLDGNRILLHIGKTSNRATSRRKSDVTFLFSEKTDNMPSQRDFLLPDYEGTVLDGEAIMPVPDLDTGSVITSSELQSTSAVLNCSPDLSKKLQEGRPIIYHIFDVIYWKGKNVMPLSYDIRLNLVDNIFLEINSRGGSNYFSRVETVLDNKKQFYQDMIAQGKEGVMLKSLNSIYEPGKRTWNWLKVKEWSEYDGIITGWLPSTEGKGYENLIGSLEVSAYDENRILRPIACVSPRSLEERKSLTQINNSGQVGLKADILGKVVTVRGREWSGKSIRLKHAVLLTWREDKSPEDCAINFNTIKSKLELGERVR
ncbi:MAG: hypothetical protein A2536_09445 [Candidatus Firestonebacteria bacterium RIFOXYD2_FULL_39_29]|nr:MAG: hypothetical protein A2536_09445 [Candidatus Firestonebacteria bacterium RIFOXYD2_FULL_39_29]